MDDKERTEARTQELRHYNALIGYRIVGVHLKPGTTPDEWYPILQLQGDIPTDTLQVEVLADPEGNGPGFLSHLL